jgi:hypothetical protein
MTLKSTPLSVAVGAALLAFPAVSALAQNTPPVSVGAGVRTSFAHTESDAPGSFESDDFELNSARIYLGGKVNDTISIMFNTEYNRSGETVRVIDAVGQFSFSEQVNIWAGRFLPPSDRANLYGPYYASHWGVYTDSIQDGYPFETEGRADGIMYWGQFGLAKVSAGAFDINGLSKDNPATPAIEEDSSDVLAAARVQLDFWDPETGYYLNGTYYGDKDLLAVGVAAQKAAADSAYSADFLFEKKLGGAGVLTIESEYAMYDGLGGYPSPRAGAYESSDGAYVLAAFLFPAEIGIGKFQVLAKGAMANFDFAPGPGNTDLDVDQETFEVNLNYIIKQFSARISLYYIDTSYDSDVAGFAADGQTYGIGFQFQM